MWVKFSHHFTDNAGGLYVSLFWAKTHFAHHEQNASLNGFQTITRIWKCTRVNDGVGVFEKGIPHLGGDINVFDTFDCIVCRGVGRHLSSFVTHTSTAGISGKRTTMKD